jgi:hypothetical protein
MRYYIPVFMAALSEIRLAVHPASRRGERGERDTERTAIEQYCARLEIHDQRSESGAGRCRGTKDVSAGNIICRSDSDSKGGGVTRSCWPMYVQANQVIADTGFGSQGMVASRKRG